MPVGEGEMKETLIQYKLGVLYFNPHNENASSSVLIFKRILVYICGTMGYSNLLPVSNIFTDYITR